MFSMQNDTHLFDAMEQWIERGENDEVKYILEQTAITDSTNQDGETLLHVAVSHDNLNVVEHLLSMGCQVDPKDSLNFTPLYIAVNRNHWAAAKILLKQNANIFELDNLGASPLSNVVVNYEPNLEVLQMFFDKVKSKCANKREFVNILVSHSCRLKNVVRLRDAEITEMFLNTPGADLSEPGWGHSSIEIAMNSIDEENMRVLLQHRDDRLAYRRQSFIVSLQNLLREYSRNESVSYAVNVTVQQFVKCQLLHGVDKASTILLEVIYQIFPETSLRPMLSDSIISYINNALGYDIRMQMFANCNCCVREITENGKVDKNLIGRRGRSTLHVAVQGGNTGTMRYLLDNGMSPNIREENGKTPLFKAHNGVGNSEQCLILLLQCGADLQATDNSGNTYIDCYHSPDFSHDLIKIVIAHLAILEVTGVPLKESFRNYVNASEETLNYFLSCCQQLEKMKTVEVFNSMTLFQILTENFEILTRRVRSLPRTIVEQFFIHCSTGLQDYDLYYTATLIDRVQRARTIGSLREKAAAVIADSIEVLKPFDLVIKKIISFLSYYDLRAFGPRFRPSGH